jgi:small subunit ribosomal protein S17
MRQNFIGMVVSTAMSKTVKVKVVRQKLHPIAMKVTFEPHGQL